MNKDESLSQVQHWTIWRKHQRLERQRSDELLSNLGSVTWSSIVDEDALDHRPRTEVVFNLLQMVDEYC